MPRRPGSSPPRLAAAVVASLSVAAPAVAGPADAPDAGVVFEAVDDRLSPFTGTWRFAGGEAERAAMRRAIDEVADRMGFFTRGIARRRLREGNVVAERLALRQDGARLTVEFDGRAFTAPVDGTAVEARSAQGDALRLRHALDGDRLVQVFEAKNGGRTNIYRVNGDRLTVDVTVHSEHLPTEVRYRLTYVRS